MFFAIVIVIALYLAINVVYIYAVPVTEMKGAVRMSEVATTALFGYQTSAWITAVITISILGALNVVTMIGPRIYYAMARDGVLFESLSHVHPRFGTPTGAIMLQAVWACFLILTNTWGTLFTYVSVVITLFSAFTVGSVIVLRYKRPDLKRPYRLWGYPIVPLLFIVVHLLIVWGSIKEKPIDSLSGFFIVALGIPIYFIWTLRGNRRKQTSEIHMRNNQDWKVGDWNSGVFAFVICLLIEIRGSMAIRITKVYTRTGDKGETALVGGKRVPKDSPRIDAYGTIDELNSIVGLARVFNEEKLNAGDAYRFLDLALRQIQDELFDLGSELATPDDFSYDGMYRVSEREVKKLEELIDECQKELGPLKSFILPGGGRIGAYLHQCRTVCRRAEREILRLSRAEPLSEWPLKYVNRLSDLFFVLSRWISKQTGDQEYLWQRGLMEKPKAKK